ncbi:MAG TPA: sigma-70 family RNA polymerase sigma factor [Steroidobacteraceae bacterium]|nr:sigma-70 family RNA polymerase sigma factor [Steroidobacteraceae bacterium]
MESVSVDVPPVAQSRQAFFSRLFERNARALLAFLARRLGGRSEAEEFAQEVWARMLELDDPQAIRDPEAYLFTVARNLVSKQVPVQRRARNTFDVDDPSVQAEMAESASIGQQVDEKVRAAWLHAWMRELKPDCRTAVSLHHFQGQSYEEVARHLNVSVNMVKKHLSQALRRGRRRLGRLR